MAAAAVVGVACGPAAALPPRGSQAPAIELKDVHGVTVSTAALRGRTLVLVFGEFAHERVAETCAEVMGALADPRIPPDAAAPILVATAAGAFPDHDAPIPEIVLLDPERDAFGAYKVIVIPSVVVVGPDGTVVCGLPGFLPRAREIVTDAVLFSSGRLSAEQFERTLAPGPGPTAAETRAGRLSRMARQLARRGLTEMAEQRYAEALAASPDDLGARVGLGELLLGQDRLDEAEACFRAALAASPGSLDASMGLAAVRIRRGGDELAAAEADLRALEAAHPSLPRLQYLLGLAHEGRREHERAAARFRRAAELLLESAEER